MAELPYIRTFLKEDTKNGRRIKDYTHFTRVDDVPGLPKEELDANGALEGKVGLILSDGKIVEGRGIICKSYNGSYLSITVRLDHNIRVQESVPWLDGSWEPFIPYDEDKRDEDSYECRYVPDKRVSGDGPGCRSGGATLDAEVGPHAGVFACCYPFCT